MEIEKILKDGEDGNKVEVFVVDGEELSPERLVSFLEDLDNTKKNTLKDYHKKTESLSEERKRLAKESDELNQKMAALSASKEAFEKDVNWYKTHDPSEWASYQSEFAKVSKVSEPGKVQDPTVTALRQELAELKDAISGLKGQTEAINSKNMKKDADESLDYALKLASSYPLADEQAVKNALYVFFTQNERVPTKVEIQKIVSTQHERVEKLVGKAKYTKPIDPVLPSGSGGGIPKAEISKPDPNVKLSDTEAATKAGRDFFNKSRTLRGA